MELKTLFAIAAVNVICATSQTFVPQGPAPFFTNINGQGFNASLDFEF